MNDIIHQKDVNSLLSKIESNFPNFIAGIITDRHGFPIATKISKNFNVSEQDIALSAISNSNRIQHQVKLMKVRRDLDKENKVQLFLLLKKTAKYLNKFKTFKEIIRGQSPF